MKFETLKEIMDDIKGVRFANMDTLTKVSLKGGKSNPFKDRVFKKAQVAIDSVSPYVFFALINKKYELEGKTEIKISELLLQKNSIGKLFNLDILALSKILDSLEKLNLITVIRTAGLDVIKLKKKLPFYECLKQYYKSINGK